MIIKVEEGKTCLFSRIGRSERRVAYYGGYEECKYFFLSLIRMQEENVILKAVIPIGQPIL